jgi:hypothetical protein
MKRVLLALALPLLLLAGCADSVWAPDNEVARAFYHDPSPPSITLFTMVANGTNSGGHSAIMINASQRVIFDPSGSWWHRLAPERNDVIYGITPQMLEFYLDYHARETYHVVIQTKEVSPEVAEQALMLVEDYGAVRNAFCARSTSDVLRQLPGFESLPRTYRPKAIMSGFARLPGVTTETLYDNDPDQHELLLREQQKAAIAEIVPNDQARR